MDLIVTLVVYAIVLGIAYWIITKIPNFATNWIVQVIFGLVCLLIVIGIFTGKMPLVKLRSAALLNIG
jgi:heme A synthase